MLSCNIFSYKGMMSVCSVQFPSAGRRVTGPRYLFVFGEICWCDRLSVPTLAHREALLRIWPCSFSLAWWPLWGCVSRIVSIILTLFGDSLGCSRRGLWGTAMCNCAGLWLPLAATQKHTKVFIITLLGCSLPKITRLAWGGQSTCARARCGVL